MTNAAPSGLAEAAVTASVTASSTTSEPEESSEGAISVADIRDAIVKKAGPGIAVTTKVVVWFPMRTAVDGMAMLQSCPENERKAVYASMRPAKIEAGKACPFDVKSIVMGMFEGEDIRVYCLGPNANNTSMVLSRYRLSKTAAIYSLDEMTPNAFIDEMADEFVQLRDGLSSAETERNAILEYGSALAPDYPFRDFLEDIREGVHLIEEEDDDEDEEDEPPVVKPAPAVKPADIPPPPVAAKAASMQGAL